MSDFLVFGVPQTGHVFTDLTVLDNLRMGGFLRRDHLDANLAGVFELFPALRDRRRARAGALSGGERRMLAIGLTLLARPTLLLLDEPSSDLSPAMMATVFDALRRIRARTGIPVLLVEQNVQAALTLADRVSVLVRGRVALDVVASRLDHTDLHALFMDGGARVMSAGGAGRAADA